MLGKMTAGLTVSIGVAMVLLGNSDPEAPETITETVLEPVTPWRPPANEVTLAAVADPVPPLNDVQPTASPAPEPTVAAAAVTPEPAPNPVAAAEIPPIRPVPRPEVQEVVPTTASLPDIRSDPDTIILPRFETVAVETPRYAPAAILYATADGVNLRDGPSQYDRIVIQLAAGDTAKLIADPGTGWLLVKTEGTGRQGFIAADLMAPVHPAD